MVNYRSFVLDNGLRVYFKQNNYLHSIGITLGVNYGFFNEKNTENGYAHLLEHMVFEGTENIKKKDLRDILDENTIYWNGETDAETTDYTFKALPSTNFKVLFYALKEMAFNSDFPSTNLHNEKEAAINEIHGNFGSEMSLEGAIARAYLFRKNTNTFFGGDVNVVNKATKTQLLDIYEKYYSPKNMLLSVVGNFKEKEIKPLICDAFGSIDKSYNKPEIAVYTGNINYREINMHNFNPKKGQSNILFGMKLPGASNLYSKSNTARASLGYIRNLLTSRFMENIRDKMGIAYQAYADMQINKNSGYLAVFSQVKSNNLEKAENMLFDEITKITEGELPPKAVEDAKMIANMDLLEYIDSALEHSKGLSDSILLYGKTPYELYKEYANITLDNLRGTANKYLKTKGDNNSVLLVSS